MRSFRTTAGLILTTLTLVVAAATTQTTAQTFTTIYSFNSTDGANPAGAPVQAINGSLYGTTYNGGANGFGTIFKITPSGKLITLHSFNSTDGSHPQGPLLQATDGNLYGTTNAGGAKNQGTVFKITPTGTLTTFYNFCSLRGCVDGAGPTAGLIQASDGNFYGTAFGPGGTNGHGSIFKITPGGRLTTLHSFCSPSDCTDGEGPFGGIIQASDGNLYGTTAYAGPNYCDYLGCGTVFRITPDGTLATVHGFDGTDGDSPWGAVVQGGDSNIYGTTFYEGAYGHGTVFQMTLSGTLIALHNFNSTDGDGPSFALIQATDGNLYGTTYYGGAKGYGTVFTVTPSGTLTTLHSFCSKADCADGSHPVGLIQATDGNLYGITYESGANGYGTVFRLSMGFGPFVSFVRNPAKVGQTFGILGQGLTGTTSVSLNGLSANFTLQRDTLLTATVPAGATSGFVTVTTPSGTLTSNVPFHVIP